MKIKTIKIRLLFIVGLSILLANTISAGDLKSKAKVEKLLSGNTVELQDMKLKKSTTWYFKTDGRLKKRDQFGNKGKEKWYVDAKGRLCIEGKHRKLRCRVLVTRSDGGYGVYEREYATNELKWVFKSVLQGNPHKL